MSADARAFWVVEPGRGEIRGVTLPRVGPGEVRVRALHSGVSRGTETLVFRGAVPPDQQVVMRAPHQEGDFPAPVKYGYLSVGVVEEGPGELLGRTVFCLHPHQTAYVVPVDAVTVVPEGVTARRAVLAGTLETAVNALWDAPPLIGDRVAVVGAGMVGCCVARLLAQVPGVTVTLVDVDVTREEVARRLGVGFAAPQELRSEAPGSEALGAHALGSPALGSHDHVVHTSGTSAGLQLAIDLLAPEGTVLELSWYGDTKVELSLGGSFHSARLGIRASQVGSVAAARRSRYTHARRLALALDLLRDPAFDALLTGESPFDDLPTLLPALADGTVPAICHTITY